ncbi:hypothetical protein AAC387_Pa01g1279 [Persea americana]
MFLVSGCVEVVGCLKCEELVCWDEVRLEGQTDFCWLCQQPQRLLVPFEMRGFQGVYNLEKRVRTQLFSIESDPCPVLSTSEVPTSRSFRSLLAKARITCIILLWLQRIENERTQSLNAAIAGARAAATQFSKKGQSKSATKYEINPCLKSDVQNLPSTSESKNNRVQEVDTKGQFGLPDGRFQRGNWYKYVERKSLSGDEANIIENNRSRNGDFNQKSGAPSKILVPYHWNVTRWTMME